MADNKQTYELDWLFERRVATQHLGALKYTTSAKALCELIANGFDAGANVISVSITENGLGGVESIKVKDDGHGISPDVLKERFISVGVFPQKANAQFAKFGIGRFAVHRIGEKSHWQSISVTKDKQYKKIDFELDSDENKKLKVTEEVDGNSETGTTIEIYNIRDKGKDQFTKNKIAGILLAEYCSYLLAHKDKRIIVQDDTLDVQSMIAVEDTDVIEPTDKVPEKIVISHLILNKPVENSRFPAQVIFTARGRMIASMQPDEVLNPQYVGMVECEHFQTILSANREALIEMDDTFANIKYLALDRITKFGEKYRTQSAKRFIERARHEDFYPYKNVPREITDTVKQEIYDVVLEKVNENANIDSMTKKQKAVVFNLLNRALDDENLLIVLTEVARLSADDVAKFKNVLERTALTSIIKLSAEVTNRLLFLEVLHNMVYGASSKKVKERTQLHKVIEPHGWLFGPQFHLATSDEGFKKVIMKHRQQAGLPPMDEDNFDAIKDVKKIPDLFLCATKEYPTIPRNHHLIVEIKAPIVSIGAKERDQIRKYADIIRKSHEFDKTSTRWDLFVVSSKISDQIDEDRKQKDKKVGCLFEWDNMTIWAFEWSEIIARAKEEMQFVRNNLKMKTEQLGVSEYLKKNYPDILQPLQYQD